MLRSTSWTAALVVAIVFLSVGYAEARAAPPPLPDPSPAVQAALDRGDALLEQGELKRARSAYREAATISRTEGALPEEPLRRLANAFYFDRDYRWAAKTLDQLAREAATAGDLRVEAQAAIDAAWLYGKLGARREMVQRLARVERLLQSPLVPDEVKKTISEHRLPEGKA